MIGIDIGLFMSGIVVVESVFGWPGIGQLAWQAIQRVDIPIIMGVTLVSAFAIVLDNFLADLIAPLIDPRIKLPFGSSPILSVRVRYKWEGVEVGTRHGQLEAGDRHNLVRQTQLVYERLPIVEPIVLGCWRELYVLCRQVDHAIAGVGHIVATGRRVVVEVGTDPTFCVHEPAEQTPNFLGATRTQLYLLLEMAEFDAAGYHNAVISRRNLHFEPTSLRVILIEAPVRPCAGSQIG